MTYRFDGFLLNPATRELHEDGVLVALPARAFDCLAYLIEHRERAVGRDELIAAVWGRTEISDALLNHTIVKLRRSLGDTGNEQRTIRTVPRFGYRWVGAVEALDAEAAPAEPPPPDEAPPAAPAAAEPAAAPAPRRRPSRGPLAAAAAAVAALALGFALAHRQPVAPSAPAVADASAAPGSADDAVAMPALVLPAEVAAPDDWRWLRLGLMDLVANRLRSGALQTMPSESVVGLLRQRSGGDDLLHDPELAKIATLRVQPSARLDGGRWFVRLDAFGSQRSFDVEADADDAIAAARAAADRLLGKLGRRAGAAASSPALDELLQHSGAAMLADQLDQARRLIEAAPAELQRMPRVQHRMAQIELRAGDYAAIEARLQPLLDGAEVRDDGALRARMLLTLAAAYVRDNRAERAGELYEEAIALRRDHADAEALGVAYLGRGVLLAQSGRIDEATAELARARTELKAVGDGLGVAGVDVNLGEFRRMQHRPADALPMFASAVRQFERLGAREGRAYALAQQAGVELELLDAPAALATTARFWPAEAHTSNRRLRWTLAAVRAQALAANGQAAEASALLDALRAGADPARDAVARAEADRLAARLALARGDAAEAARLAAAAAPALRDAVPDARVRALALEAEAARAAGDAPQAQAAVQALRREAGGDGWRAIYAGLAEAQQAWAEQRRGAALEAFAAALAAAARYGVPEDMVAVAAPYVPVLIETSQLDTARAVAGRIAPWADRDLRAATAQARLFRALGQDDAARQAEQGAARLAGGRAGPG